jgi:hypothetical protein
VVKRAIDEETRKTEEKDQNIQRLKKKLESSGSSDLRAGQLRAKILSELPNPSSFDGAFGKRGNEISGEPRTLGGSWAG